MAFSGYCQLLEIDWEKRLGTRSLDIFTDVIENLNGGYTVVGSTVPEGKNDLDFWLMNFNRDGSVASSKSFGTEKNDYPASVVQSSIGDFIIVGKSKVAENEFQSFIIKTDAEGNELWQKSIDGTLQNLSKV